MLSSLLGCAVAAAPPPQAASSPAAVAKPEQPAPGEPPPDTPVPPARPGVLVELDLAPFFSEITRGTGVRLQPALLADAWPVAGMDMDRPALLAKRDGDSSATLLLSATKPGARFSFGPADAALAARGLKPVQGTGCALHEAAAGGPALLCGEREALLAYSGTLLGRIGQLPPGSIASATLRLGPALGKPLYELRAGVPSSIDPLLPSASSLGAQPALRLGLHDLGYEVSSRLLDAYESLEQVKLSVATAAPDAFSLSAALPLADGSLLARAVAGAKPARVPAAFWELSEHTDTALFFDSSLLLPFVTPSPRSLTLLSAARGSSSALVDGLSALPAACLQPGQGVALASGRFLDDQPKPKKSGPPTLEPFPPQRPKSPPSYALYGLEDKRGACAKALEALVSGYEDAIAPAIVNVAERPLRRQIVEKPLPKGVMLLELGSKNDASYLSVFRRPGAIWIASSADLPTLKAVLTDMLVPVPKRRGLRARAELLELGKATGLVSAFVRRDLVPMMGEARPPGQVEALSARAADSNAPRLPFQILSDAGSLRITGRVETRAVRNWFARIVAEQWGSAQLSALPPKAQAAALALVDAACRLGYGEACNLLGVVYGDGRGVAKDPSKAIAVLELGCEQGNGMACANLPFYKKPDKAEELRSFKKSCELGAAHGCAWWGVRLLDGDKPEEKAQAFEKLSAGCDGFVGFACARIGMSYTRGDGLPQDESKGADFLERACDLRLGVGCVGIGDAYVSGKGRKHDGARAFEYFKRACQLDKGNGCFALGYAYLNGEGTARDAEAARQNFQIACEADEAEACRQLAEMESEP